MANDEDAKRKGALPKPTHFIFALGVAVTLHGALWLLVRPPAIQRKPALVPRSTPSFEVSLVDPSGRADAPRDRARPLEARSAPFAPSRDAPPASGLASRLPDVTSASIPEVQPDPTPPMTALEGGTAQPTPGLEESQTNAPTRQPIDLGLNGGVARSTALAMRMGKLPSAVPNQTASAERPPRAKPSVGWLEEGLEALDAERGLSRSSAAISASYRAARREAPPSGTGIFDVRTNAQGLVVSVALVSAGGDASKWRNVAESLHQELRGKRLRVPKGKKGLETRLRIERGQLSQSLAERGRTKRGTTAGQEPLHPREQRGESTKESEGPGQLSPTLGISVAGGHDGHPTRVVLLSQREL